MRLSSIKAASHSDSDSTVQDLIAIALIALAAGYLGWRYLKQRKANTCCGADVCPAMKRSVDRISKSA